jgi:hypothetical protein
VSDPRSGNPNSSLDVATAKRRLPLGLQGLSLFDLLRTRTIFQPLEVCRELVPLGLGTLEIILKVPLVKSGNDLSCLGFVSLVHEQCGDTPADLER